MRIEKVDNTNFNGGNVNLQNIDSKNLKTFNSIKKLAKDYNIDIYISKNINTKYFPTNDFFAAFVQNTKYIFGASCAITKKNMSATATSINIYNMVISAIENLNNKVKNKLNKKAFI